jgi:Tfp pilus assembly PilM family ATPase
MVRWRLPWHRSIGPIGLDLGAETPRAMQVRAGGDAPVAACAIRCAPTDGLVARAASAARELHRAGFVGREVVVGLSPADAPMLVARMPVLEGDDAREAVAWEAAERTAIPREQLVADSVATGAPSNAQQDGREERLVVAAPLAALDEALSVLLEAGLEPIAVEPRFASVARALARRARRDADVAQVRAVLHVDRAGSTVMVLRGDRIAFCREISIGGATLDDAVAARLGVSTEQAATLRMRRMAAIRGVAPAVDSVADDAALGATRATLDALAGELALCLRYFGVTFRGGQPSRVILSGTDAAEPRLAGILEEACRTSVVSFESELPSAFASSALDAFHSDDGLAPWTGAFGLACRSRLLKEARAPLATNAGERAA